jgi:uncharacterized protein
MGVDPHTIAKITASIKELVNPKSIIMFGSHATGNAGSDSDIDLLVVDDSGREKNSVALEISRALFPRDYGLDLFVESPDDLRQKSQYGFWQEVLNTGKVLYERE